MPRGSTLVGFEVKGGKAAAFRFLDALQLVRISNNLGDAKSLVTHPATTTHQRLTPEARAAEASALSEGFLRFGRAGSTRTTFWRTFWRRWRRCEGRMCRGGQKRSVPTISQRVFG